MLSYMLSNSRLDVYVDLSCANSIFDSGLGLPGSTIITVHAIYINWIFKVQLFSVSLTFAVDHWNVTTKPQVEEYFTRRSVFAYVTHFSLMRISLHVHLSSLTPLRSYRGCNTYQLNSLISIYYLNSSSTSLILNFMPSSYLHTYLNLIPTFIYYHTFIA